MSAKTELARRVLEALAEGHTVPSQDALQLRNWSVAAEDAMLPLDQIARRILQAENDKRRSG
jgi:hypothetical protein